MTTGHRHRTIKLPSDSRRLRLLRKPIQATTDRERVEKSRWVWGVEKSPHECETPKAAVYTLGGWCVPTASLRYILTPLGILHTLIGLTVDVQNPGFFPEIKVKRGGIRFHGDPK